MDTKALRSFLNHIAGKAGAAPAGKDSPPGVAAMPGGVTMDTARPERTGLCETVLGLGKTPEQLAACVQGLAQAGQPVLATRLDAGQGAMLAKAFPQGRFHEAARLFVLGREICLDEPWPQTGEALVVCAGASDLAVALEALGSALFFGLECGLVSGVGVTGLHRLSPHLGALSRARVILAVAGMDGALPGLLAGLTSAPVVAVPTSTGYGTALGGLSALLTMLNSCSPGVAVMNIDNGFGAAAFAARLLCRRPPGP